MEEKIRGHLTPAMPPHDPPFRPSEVRDLYRNGTWAYALGKPAWSHPKYKRAVSRARRVGFNPWWIRNWSDVEAVLDGCYMDETAGRRVVDYQEMLVQFEGEFCGKPLILSDWQKYDVDIPLFGWLRPDGTRRFRRSVEFIPKKNGKTTRCAARLIYLISADHEPGAEVYTATTSREQSAKMFRAACEMLKRSHDLLNEFEMIPSRYRIVHPATASFYQALPEVPESAEGFNIHGLMRDEIHVWKNRAQYDSFKYGGRARRQPLDSTISTAGIYDPTSIGYEEYEYAKSVIDAHHGAERDWSLFAYICELGGDELEMWAEPSMAIKTNPNIGISIMLEGDQEAAAEAAARLKNKNTFLRYLRNVWVNALDTWMPSDQWAAAAGDYAEDDLVGETCYAAIDCSLSDDISALVLWFPPQAGRERHRLLPYFWVPDGSISRRDAETNGWYSMWKTRGCLFTTPGQTIDQEYIRKKISELGDKFSIRTIAYDQAFAAKLAKDLEGDGFDVGSFGQGFSAMNEPTQKFMDLVLNGELEHPNHPVMNWHVGNAMAVRDGGDRIRLVKNWGEGKGKSKKRYKIDGAIAAIMALGTSLLDEHPVDWKMEVQWI